MTRLGSATVTADQTGFGSGTETDVTGATSTVTVNPNRRLRIYWIGSASDTLADTGGMVFRIKEGATVLKELRRNTQGGTRTTAWAGWVEVDNPSAGSHTYKISFQAVTPSGTVTFRASATSPALLMIEDIGSH